ncbi:MAG: phage virion morphogenesis protein [Deltaproteobacteria bacterium]|nr:phage virion morphogenesis protein [Deltaproteobacteria bacterium]
MAGASLQCRVDGLGMMDRAGIRLDRLVKFDFLGLHRDIGQALENSTLERFAKGEDPEGKPWKESGRVTAANARRKPGERRPGGKTLQDTARLKGSIHFEAEPDQVEVGTDVIYARIHQLGGETGRPGGRFEMPVRAFLGMSGDDDRLVETMYEDRIKERLL